METEKTLLNATVCLLVQRDEVQLGIKMGKIGKGCRNGPGGGIEEGETIKQSAIRELEEETGKKIGNKYITTSVEFLEKVAIIDFHNTKTNGETFICKVHFFIVRQWKGEAVDTKEMTDLKPFKISELPVDQMMPADRKFFKKILSGKKIVGIVKYGPYQKELLEEPIFIEVDSFEE
ncbi:MAG: NUDIX domain-containing protein [bacterium]